MSPLTRVSRELSPRRAFHLSSPSEKPLPWEMMSSIASDADGEGKISGEKLCFLLFFTHCSQTERKVLL